MANQQEMQMMSLMKSQGILDPYGMQGGEFQQNPDQLLTDNYGPSLAPQQGALDMVNPQNAAWGAALMNIGDIIGGRAPSTNIASTYMQAKMSNDKMRQNRAAKVRQAEQDNLQRRNIESQIAERDAKANLGGNFAGTGIEAQMLNAYLNSLPPEQREQARLDMVRQRLERPTTISTPEGTYTRPGYQLPQTGQQPTNQLPSFTQKPLTGEQAKASGFYDRMIASQGEINRLFSEAPDFNPADTAETVASSIPGVGNMMISPEKQQYMQAANDWIRAKLRRESGAVIGEEEAKAEYRTYFPMPGDSKEVIAQKARSRKTAENAMREASGPRKSKAKKPSDRLKELRAKNAIK